MTKTNGYDHHETNGAAPLAPEPARNGDVFINPRTGKVDLRSRRERLDAMAKELAALKRRAAALEGKMVVLGHELATIENHPEFCPRCGRRASRQTWPFDGEKPGERLVERGCQEKHAWRTPVPAGGG